MAQQYKLTYFNARGRGEPLRFLLAYAKVPFEDNRIERDDWPKLKETTPWGQLPLLEVDGVQLSQTKAIARYIAKKHGLAGTSDLEQAKCDEYMDTIDDILAEVGKWAGESDEGKKATLKKALEEEVLPKYFTKFEALLKKNGNGLFVGSKLTYADIFISNAFANMGAYFPLLDKSKFPQLQKHNESVLNQPGIKEYVAKRPETAY